jgi:hypothetical protein
MGKYLFMDIVVPFMAEACVDIITSRKWHEGFEKLVDLLRDKRDISQSLGSNYDMPDCHVARVAAKGLAVFKNKKKIIVPHIIHLLEEGQKAQRDPMVHCILIELLGEWKGEDSRKCLIGLLNDDWQVESYKRDALQIRRHAAAWALIESLRKQDIPLLDKKLLSDDPRIASPLFVGAIFGQSNSKDRLLDIARLRQAKDNLPWMNLFASAYWSKHKTATLFGKEVSDELMFWFNILTEKSDLFCNISGYDIKKYENEVNSLLKVIEGASYIMPAFAFTIYQWFGEEWINLLESKNLYKSCLP